jgi:hypothetical protein
MKLSQLINEAYTDEELLSTALQNLAREVEYSDRGAYNQVLNAIHWQDWSPDELYVAHQALNRLLNTKCSTERGRKYRPQVESVITNLKEVARNLGKNLI